MCQALGILSWASEGCSMPCRASTRSIVQCTRHSGGLVMHTGKVHCPKSKNRRPRGKIYCKQQQHSKTVAEWRCVEGECVQEATRGILGNVGSNQEIRRARLSLPGGPGRGKRHVQSDVILLGMRQRQLKCSYKIALTAMLSLREMKAGDQTLKLDRQFV